MAKKQVAREPEVLPAESPDLRLVETDGNVVAQFLGNLATFFRGAMQLETRAKQRLATAEKLTAPTTVASDEAIQVFIKETRTELKNANTYWGICQAVSGLHKKLTAGRSRTTDTLERAATIGQNLHNRYVEDERRRAAQEQEKKRLEAEERARQDRERELAELERQRLEREATMENLSEREEAFVHAIVNGADSFKAAQTAGFAQPRTQAERLLGTPKIIAAIAALREARALEQQAAAVRQQPLQVAEVEEVRPNISRAAGIRSRTTHGSEVLDESAFVAAVISGKHGIPWDVLTVNRTKLNDYAESLQERLNAWPGVRYTKKTTNY